MGGRHSIALGLVAMIALVTGSAVPAGAAEIDRLGWLAGCWGDGDEARSSEECWLAPKGNLLLGVHRDIRGERSSFEYMRIAADGDEVTYFAGPGGQEPTAFRMIELGEQRVVFENPEHDFPQRILYWLDETGRLHARIEGTVEGEPQSADWVWPRAGGW